MLFAWSRATLWLWEPALSLGRDSLHLESVSQFHTPWISLCNVLLHVHLQYSRSFSPDKPGGPVYPHTWKAHAHTDSFIQVHLSVHTPMYAHVITQYTHTHSHVHTCTGKLNPHLSTTEQFQSLKKYSALGKSVLQKKRTCPYMCLTQQRQEGTDLEFYTL